MSNLNDNNNENSNYQIIVVVVNLIAEGIISCWIKLSLPSNILWLLRFHIVGRLKRLLSFYQ